MARKRVTVDQLAAMVASALQALQEEMREGFRVVQEHLGGHDRRFQNVESKLESV